MFCSSFFRANRLLHHLMTQGGSMKSLKAASITLMLLFCWMVNAYADRLYTWTDAKGVTHITQDPPPDTAKPVDTIDYSPQPNQPVSRSTGSDQAIQQQGNLGQGGERSGNDSGSGFTSADEGKDVQYDGDSYRRTLLRYEIKHKILDDNEPVIERDLPVKVQPHLRKR
jgi:hypothetical protein